MVLKWRIAQYNNNMWAFCVIRKIYTLTFIEARWYFVKYGRSFQLHHCSFICEPTGEINPCNETSLCENTLAECQKCKQTSTHIQSLHLCQFGRSQVKSVFTRVHVWKRVYRVTPKY